MPGARRERGRMPEVRVRKQTHPPLHRLAHGCPADPSCSGGPCRRTRLPCQMDPEPQQQQCAIGTCAHTGYKQLGRRRFPAGGPFEKGPPGCVVGTKTQQKGGLGLLRPSMRQLRCIIAHALRRNLPGRGHFPRHRYGDERKAHRFSLGRPRPSPSRCEGECGCAFMHRRDPDARHCDGARPPGLVQFAGMVAGGRGVRQDARWRCRGALWQRPFCRSLESAKQIGKLS